MAFKRPPPSNFNDLIRRYKAGEPYGKLAQEVPISESVFRRWLLERNVHLRTKSEQLRLAWNDRGRVDIDVPAAIAALEAGTSMKQLAADLGVDRPTLTNRIVATGYRPRGRSEAMRLRWQQTDDPLPMLSAAWEAAKAPRSEATRLIMAESRYRYQSTIGRHESELASALTARKITVTQQLPVGPYNIDVAVNVPPIAVEIQTSSPNRTRGAGRASGLQRTKYLLDRGWIVLHVNCRVFFDIDGLTEYVVALTKKARRDKSLRGRYGMIRGNGEPGPRRRSQFDQFPRIPGT